MIPTNLKEFKEAVDDTINHPDATFFTSAILPLWGTSVWDNDATRSEALQYFEEKRPEKFKEFVLFKKMIHQRVGDKKN